MTSDMLWALLGALLGLALNLWVTHKIRKVDKPDPEAGAKCTHGKYRWHSCRDCAEEFAAGHVPSERPYMAPVDDPLVNTGCSVCGVKVCVADTCTYDGLVACRVCYQRWARNPKDHYIGTAAEPAQRWMRLKATGELVYRQRAYYPYPIDGPASLVDRVDCGLVQCWYYDHGLEPALPRAGEWWQWTQHTAFCISCAHPGAQESRRLRGTTPWLVETDFPANGLVRNAVRNGCIVPVHFGKGLSGASQT